MTGCWLAHCSGYAVRACVRAAHVGLSLAITGAAGIRISCPPGQCSLPPSPPRPSPSLHLSSGRSLLEGRAIASIVVITILFITGQAGHVPSLRATDGPCCVRRPPSAASFEATHMATATCWPQPHGLMDYAVPRYCCTLRTVAHETRPEIKWLMLDRGQRQESCVLESCVLEAMK